MFCFVSLPDHLLSVCKSHHRERFVMGIGTCKYFYFMNVKQTGETVEQKRTKKIQF